ncbi:MAG: hypothetical protein U1A77_00530 [Pirellulales bacterium]
MDRPSFDALIFPERVFKFMAVEFKLTNGWMPSSSKVEQERSRKQQSDARGQANDGHGLSTNDSMNAQQDTAEGQGNPWQEKKTDKSQRNVSSYPIPGRDFRIATDQHDLTP